LLVLGGGCPNVPTDGTGNGNANGGGTGDIETKIVNTTSDIEINLNGNPLSVIYSVGGTPDSIQAFFRFDEDGAAVQIIVNANGDPLELPAGNRRQFLFDPAQAGVGRFRVGIIVTDDGVPQTFTSLGVITVQGPPVPMFTAPTAPVTEVSAGQSVTIRFDAGDPENEAQWRLFVLEPGDSLSVRPDQLGRELSVSGASSGNVGVFFFSTANLAPGDYQLGLSATDDGFSVLRQAERDPNLIVTIPNANTQTPIVRVRDDSAVQPKPPTLTISVPTAAGALIFGDEDFTVQFAATINEEGATGTVELFHDTDRVLENGRVPFASALPAATTSKDFPTNLPEGEYFVGGLVDDGVNPVVSAYATGSVTVVRTPTLIVTAPSTSLPIRPNSGLVVAWSTNVPSTAATVSVFSETVDEDGDVDGFPEVILLSSAGATSTLFTPSESGLYRVSVRLT
jgi:hypothetical protein